MDTIRYLLSNADAPIRYRVAREVLHDDALAKSIAHALLEHPTVKRWLGYLKPETPPQHWSMAHGSFDFCLENALPKLVQLGLHAGLPQVADAVQFYMERIGHDPGKPCRNRAGDAFERMLCCNLMACAGFADGTVRGFLLESLEELYAFVREGRYDLYADSAERAALCAIPAVYRDRKIIKRAIADERGFCYPLIYDIVGLSALYALGDAQVDGKIDTVIRYIATDAFHRAVDDGYGVLPPFQGRYHTMGWDPKFPGWFDVAGYMATRNAPKLLFFAQHIARYPAARQTAWFGDVLKTLDRYQTAQGTYVFPAGWLKEQQGYAVLGNHMSFGENRRKQNWREIESTFYVQLIKACDGNPLPRPAGAV